MCGVVGYVGHREAEEILIASLLRLEYRGYDSAGIATLSTKNTQTHIRRAVGKLSNLRLLLEQEPCEGQIGIGHTRWATHGKPTKPNAHPHYSDGITIVHNGIIENHFDIREQLLKQGRVLQSDTDTELVAHLIAIEMRTHQGNFSEVVRSAIKCLKGAFAFAILNEKEPDTIVCVKQSCPLIIGIGDDENFIASDFPAILPYTKRFIILNEGDIATVTQTSVHIVDMRGITQDRPITILDWPPLLAEKGGFKHFMLKEIYEQPIAVMDTLRGRLSFDQPHINLDELNIPNFNRIILLACGSSYHAAMMAKYRFEECLQIPIEVDLASEFRYRAIVVDKNTLVIGISQSGETADTLAALKHAHSKGAPIMAICNAIGSAITRLCESSVGTLYTRAGPEISVASTKALVCQFVALELLNLTLSQIHGTLDVSQIQEHMEALSHLPATIETVLHQDPSIREIASHFLNTNSMLYLGRGSLYPAALEGALKMKELSYIHAEGYAAGEMKHGAIALIDENMPVVTLALASDAYEKTASNLEEVRTRGGRIIGILSDGDDRLRSLCEHVITVPVVHRSITPILGTIPLQLLAYHMSDLKGLDVDQPRNLAKSVTVE